MKSLEYLYGYYACDAWPQAPPHAIEEDKVLLTANTKAQRVWLTRSIWKIMNRCVPDRPVTFAAPPDS